MYYPGMWIILCTYYYTYVWQQGHSAPADEDPYLLTKKGKKRFDPTQAVPRFSQEGMKDYNHYLNVMEALEPICSWIAKVVSIFLFDGIFKPV